MALSPLDRVQPIVDAQGCASQRLQTFSEDCARLTMLTGTGSPEGLVTASVTRVYLDVSSGVGVGLYVKQYADVGGDRSKGWVMK